MTEVLQLADMLAGKPLLAERVLANRNRIGALSRELGFPRSDIRAWLAAQHSPRPTIPRTLNVWHWQHPSGEHGGPFASRDAAFAAGAEVTGSHAGLRVTVRRVNTKGQAVGPKARGKAEEAKT